VAGGLKDRCVLWQTRDERESVMAWWYETKSSGGAHAIVVSESTPDLKSDCWLPSSVQGLFEFGKQ